LPAGSSQRGLIEAPHPDAGAAGGGPILLDERAAAEAALIRAQQRDLEARTANDARRTDAEVALLRAQTEKVEAELARRPVEDEEHEKRIEILEARVVREWLWMLLPALLLTIAMVAGVSENQIGGGMEIFSGEGWWPMGLPVSR
jgi:hypothetical protein